MMTSNRAPSVRLSMQREPITYDDGGLLKHLPGPTRYVVEYDDGTTAHHFEVWPDEWQRLAEMVRASDVGLFAHVEELLKGLGK